MTVIQPKNPHDHNTEQQAWCDHLMEGLFDVIYASIDENKTSDDPIHNPSFGREERDAVNILITIAGAIFAQHGCGAYENMDRYVDGLKALLNGLNEDSSNE